MSSIALVAIVIVGSLLVWKTVGVWLVLGAIGVAYVAADVVGSLLFSDLAPIVSALEFIIHFVLFMIALGLIFMVKMPEAKHSVIISERPDSKE